MIMITKGQLADLLREAFKLGYESSDENHNGDWGMDASDEYWKEIREEEINPIIRRYFGVHDDHGREVE